MIFWAWVSNFLDEFEGGLYFVKVRLSESRNYITFFLFSVISTIFYARRSFTSCVVMASHSSMCLKHSRL